MKRIKIFVLATLVSFALMYFSYLPVIGVLGRILVLFSTLTHEMGHGLTAILMGGDFGKFVIHWDGSGLTSSFGNFAQGAIAAGGLIGPSCAAALLFWSARGSDSKLKTATRIFGLGLFVVGVLTARSIWALVFTVGLGALLLFLASKWNRTKLESLMVFIGVQLGLSVFTRADYLFTQEAGPDLPSDVANMASALFLPYWFWGIVCGLFSVAVLLWGCRCYIKD